MAARPSSPTSLLWAHQLKREHGFLLKRMQDLEASSERQAKRIKTAESAAKSGCNVDVATLAKQMKDLNEDHANGRLTKLEDDLKQKTEDLEAGTEAITMQIAAMQRDAEAQTGEKQRVFNKEKALLKRIVELETGLQTYKQSMDQLGRRMDDSQFEHIKAQLEALTKQVVSEGSQMKMLVESITALEAANEELKRTNQQLMAKLEEVAAHTVPTKDTAFAGSDEAAVTEQVLSSDINMAPQKSGRGKKRKLSDRDADRGSVMSGALPLTNDLVPMSNNVKGASAAGTAKGKETRRRPALKEKHKPIDPRYPPPTEMNIAKPKKSHKWAGGGADRDIIRSGRGWVEVEEPLQSAAGNGQPKKRIATPHWTMEEAMTQGRATRRGHQAYHPVEAEEGAGNSQSSVKKKANPKHTKVASKATPGKASPGGRPQHNVVAQSSILDSPSRPQIAGEAALAAPRPRRRIIQDD